MRTRFVARIVKGDLTHMQERIAVLMTCHNRKDKTIACLEVLRRQQLSVAVKLNIILVADGCTDGTSEEVRREFPDVQILQGDGSLYWNGGMRVAFQEAAKGSFDYYLWLNDDTVLLPSGINSLLRTISLVDSKGHGQAIIVGSLCDKNSGQLTYGGVVRTSCWNLIRFECLRPSGVPQSCDTMNGNCVLIPVAATSVLGNLNPVYRHGMGDFDYGLQATKHGFTVWVAPEYVGFCSRNKISGTWHDTSLSFSQRWTILTGPKGLPPSGWMNFCRTHTGPIWLLFFFNPYVRLLSSLIYPGTIVKFSRKIFLSVRNVERRLTHNHGRTIPRRGK